MGEKTSISWTDVTWNIARGCTKVDEDCRACYMYRDSFDGTRYNPKKVVRTKTVFDLPKRLKYPQKVFVSSLTDWAHDDIDPYRHEMWDIIRKYPQHTYQLLTKRPERIKQCLPPDWGNGWQHVWLGTSSGSMASTQRIDDLVEIPALTRFLSIEPLWGPVEIPFDIPFAGHSNDYYADRIDWVIVGGESGHDTGKYRYRECKLEWIEKIITDCQYYGIPVFVKQLGTHLAKELNLKHRHGADMSEWPEQFRIQKFPT